AVAALALVGVSSIAIAHEDDGKVRDRQKAVRARAWREAVEGAQGGVADENFSSNAMTLKAWFPLNTIDAGATSGNDCWGYVSPSGREYAIMCVSNGTAVYEITNAALPVKLGFVPGAQSLWRDAKVFDKYCYVVTEGGVGIQIIDLGNVDAGQISLVNTVTAGGNLATHNVAIDTESGFLYRCGGGSNGLRIYDLNASKTNPPFVGQWNNIYVHDAQVVRFNSGPYAGKQIAFCCGGLNGGNVETGLYIVDVTNKAAPVQISRILYPNARYSHQGWLSEDRRFFFLGDELDEGNSQPLTTSYVIDVQNIAAPVYRGLIWNSSTAITHNCYTHQGKLFAANYRSGIRVFDVSSPNPPAGVSEVAYFDTYPGDDYAQFNGLWSCYPYFPSGTIIGSDLERGLFVWRLSLPSATFAVANPPALIAPQGETPIDVTVNPVSGATLNPNSGKMIVTGPGISIERPLVQVSGTTGAWLRADPVFSAAQPDNDHSATGALCWITGNGPIGGAAGDADVDGGFTTLLSPTFDLSSMDEPYLEYWYWYSNNQGGGVADDSMPVEISNDGGQTWALVENVQSNAGVWSLRSWRVRDWVQPTASVRLRFTARDTGTGSVVEAGVDDFRVIDISCMPDEPADLNGDGLVNGADLTILLSVWGSSNPQADLDGNGSVGAGDIAILLNAWG
ncbi:MAG: choice-of-anchor B family protein, partial [Planctomycetaceae bacterium]|nr:choice-of-anchor B family protein [Planctomycetaceae bacterium]